VRMVCLLAVVGSHVLPAAANVVPAPGHPQYANMAHKVDLKSRPRLGHVHAQHAAVSVGRAKGPGP
jgi:hypothetical protein